MRMLLIHQAFASPGEPGGTRHYEFGQHLVKRGHNLIVVTSDLSYLTGKNVRQAAVTPNPRSIQVLPAYTYPALHRSFVHRVVSFLSFMLSSFWTALRVGSIDVVMGTSPPIFQAVSAWLVAWLRRRPYLLEIRDLWPEFAIDMGVLNNRLLIRLSRWLEHFLYARATHILVNSPAYRDYLIKQGVSIEKISFIPNGVDPDMFDPEATGETIRQQWQLDEQFVVTYAGAMGMANDIPTILRAANRLRDHRDIHFLLVGDGKERANAEAMTRELDLPNVTFTGALPKSQMGEVLAASDACLATLKDIPMFRTTYPNKVFDYMAAGRPTLLAIDGVIREVVEAAGGGICVHPGDDAALAEAVLELSKDRQQARAIGQAARAYVTQHFNRRDHTAMFRQLVEQVAGKKKEKLHV